MEEKLGRLGRPFITKENDYLTWWDDYEDEAAENKLIKYKTRHRNRR